jgi:hypothetical protein
MRLADRLQTSGTQRNTLRGTTVTRNGTSAVEKNGSIVKSTTSGPELSSYVPTDCEFAESFGGGSEFFPFLRPPLWPFNLIRLFGQEEE